MDGLATCAATPAGSHTRSARQFRKRRAQFRDDVEFRAHKDDRAQARICTVFRELDSLRGALLTGIPIARYKVSVVSHGAEFSRNSGKGTGSMKLGFRQGTASVAVFGAVLLMLVSVDDRVRDRFGDLVGTGGMTPWGDRVGDLGNALMSAIRYQSIENAPLLIFAAAGAVLVAFMLRT
jgi:hypothetical protein